MRAENLGCDRGGNAVLRGVDLTVTPGEAVQLFGANGAGKTSLLNVFAGHIRASEGSLSWRSNDTEAWSSARPHGAVLFIAHAVPLKSALTAAENLQFWASAYGVPRADQGVIIADALDRVNMSDFSNAKAGKLSAGQRRRLDIARAIMARREVWLMDEPAAAVDANGAGIIAALIRAHLQQGGVAIMATHDTLGVESRKLVIG
ncbi:MAG: heme ABC exporter ATP-binding protein CcmA [Hyphococcus sp.]